MFHKLIANTGGWRAIFRLNRPALQQIKLTTRLSNAPALDYVADFTKAINNPMNYKCLFDESYKKLGSIFLAGICLFKVNTIISWR